MKISKIFAGMSALAIAVSTFAMTASANSIPPTNSIATNGKESWEAIYSWEDYIDSRSLPDGSLTVTVTFEWTDKAKALGYTSFKPMAANGSEAAGKSSESYIDVPVQGSDVIEDPLKEDEEILAIQKKDEADRTDEEKEKLSKLSATGWVYASSGEEALYGMTGSDQGDNAGWVQFWWDENNPITELTFTLSSDYIAELKDTSSYFADGTDAEDGSKWDGFNIQTGNNGIIITNVEYDADVTLHSEMPEEPSEDENKTDESSKSDESKADNSSSGDSTSKADTSSAAGDGSSASDTSSAADGVDAGSTDTAKAGSSDSSSSSTAAASASSSSSTAAASADSKSSTSSTSASTTKSSTTTTTTSSNAAAPAGGGSDGSAESDATSNAASGAAAGVGLAITAVAAAAIVVSKRRD